MSALNYRLREQARSHIWISVNQIDGCRLYSIKGGSWLACDGINWLCLIDRGACVAGKPAPTEKPSSAVLAVCTRSTCGSGLAREGGGSVTHELTDTPHSRASPLPHLDRSASDRDVLLCCCPAFASTTQVGYQAAVLCS